MVYPQVIEIGHPGHFVEHEVAVSDHERLAQLRVEAAKAAGSQAVVHTAEFAIAA